MHKLIVSLKHAFLLLMFPLLSHGQEEEIIDHQLWFDIITHFEINNRLEYFGDMSYRTSLNRDKIRRLMVRPSIRYHWTYELDVIAGLGINGTWDTNNYNTVEIRPYQGLRLNWPRIWRISVMPKHW